MLRILGFIHIQRKRMVFCMVLCCMMLKFYAVCSLSVSAPIGLSLQSSSPIKTPPKSSRLCFDLYFGHGNGFFEQDKEPYHTEPKSELRRQRTLFSARMVLHIHLHWSIWNMSIQAYEREWRQRNERKWTNCCLIPSLSTLKTGGKEKKKRKRKTIE